jgi:hypothetical protein
MSVILECQSGDPMYCIATFSTCPRGTLFSWAQSREIKVGEKVTFRGSEEDEHFKDHPNRWQVIYETLDGLQFQAVAYLFVTEETWLNILEYCQHLNRDGQNGKPASGPLKSTA